MIACMSIVGYAYADEETFDALILKCEKLKRQTDRDKCLQEVVRNTIPHIATQKIIIEPTPTPSPSKKDIALMRAEPALNAAEAIQSVISIGVSYNDYGTYIQKFGIILDQYKSVAILPEEKLASTNLDLALQAFIDARAYWHADIEFFSEGDNRMVYFSGLPANLAGTTEIIERYNIPLTKTNIWSISKGAPRSVALRIIWKEAKNHILDARSFLNSKEDTQFQN